MLILILLKGILMGVAIAAPVGPIGVLCIRRTLSQGRLVGLVTGLGAATADGFYGMVAAFGLSAISNALVAYSNYLQTIGGLFLCYLGLTTFFSKTDFSEANLSDISGSTSPILNYPNLPKPLNLSVFSAYISTLGLTLTNPATILSFIAIFAGLGITQTHTLTSVTLVAGVFTGSAAWWLVLVSGVIYLRNRLTPLRLATFNRWSTKVFGILILSFGIAALVL